MFCLNHCSGTPRLTRRSLKLSPSAAALCFLGSLLFAIAPGSSAQTQAPGGISLPTSLRIQNPGWWPTKGDRSRDEYAGPAECAKCHADKALPYRNTAMAHAASRAADSEHLRRHDHLTFELGPYKYELVTTEQKSVLKVSDPKSSFTADLLWAMGLGRMGQTYLYQHNGNFYESHLSFYGVPQALDITPGHPPELPASTENAAGRLLSQDDTQRCFGCHTSFSKTKNEFDPASASPGVTCESCHGPGAKHVTAMTSGSEQPTADAIFNPAALNPSDAVDFCGACHRTWQDVVGSGLMSIGLFNVRFAPYRLENSRCWKQQDARLTCAACHDPHKQLVHETSFYDSRCLACHVEKGAKLTADHPGHACPVSNKDCVTCHMPKLEPPGLHSAFTDHWIRIVRPGKPYPN